MNRPGGSGLVSGVLVSGVLVFGAELMSSAISDGDNLTQRLTKAWQLLLPAITNDDSLPYFREFLARESLRRFEPTLSIE